MSLRLYGWTVGGESDVRVIEQASWAYPMTEHTQMVTINQLAILNTFHLIRLGWLHSF